MQQRNNATNVRLTSDFIPFSLRLSSYRPGNQRFQPQTGGKLKLRLQTPVETEQNALTYTEE